AEALGLEAAGAVERQLAVDIARDLAGLERAEPYHRGIQRKPGLVAVGDADTGMERDRAARHRLQLPDRAFAVAGLAEWLAVERCNLVGSDHPGDAPGGNRGRLGDGEPAGKVGRRLARCRGLVDVRPGRVEGDAEARQQLASIRRGGRQDEPRRHQATGARARSIRTSWVSIRPRAWSIESRTCTSSAR